MNQLKDMLTKSYRGAEIAYMGYKLDKLDASCKSSRLWKSFDFNYNYHLYIFFSYYSVLLLNFYC